MYLDVGGGGRVAGQVDDIITQVQLAGIHGAGILAEILVQQVGVLLPCRVEQRLAADTADR